MTTKIEYANESWNPITGCTPISDGCKNCYAKRMSRRLAGRFGYPKAPNHFDVTIHNDKLHLPGKWKKTKRVFVCSMSDLFHPQVPTRIIYRIWLTMQNHHQHTFLILTKRPTRMQHLMNTYSYVMPALQNIWLGVSVENQHAADHRIQHLLETAVTIKFVSVAPMLDHVDLTKYLGGLDLVICEGESGPGARPMKQEWARDLRDQCIDAKVNFFFKQWGAWYPAYSGKKHTYFRLGKKNSGRNLDGRTWDQLPI